jgi:hypothetical protein
MIYWAYADEGQTTRGQATDAEVQAGTGQTGPSEQPCRGVSGAQTTQTETASIGICGRFLALIYLRWSIFVFTVLSFIFVYVY